IGRTVEILDRAAIVRTFTQLDEIEYVSFQVEGTPLSDHYGNVIGNMSADTFIFNVGNEINTYEKVELKLYFANEAGDKLVPVYRSVVYNSNISMERLALEQLISGPNTDICYPTIAKDCKINSISVRDGVCYIDFDAALLNNQYNITEEVALYSVVNTIVELSEVNKVSFSVNGESTFKFKDATISGVYERNLDVIE
ncbi:MAG: GerMN domain-containing protein, partial [Lachnospiraceae bacterium]|nr:GerMN domain-containing protein [Lachnospiraceae bacterium]